MFTSTNIGSQAASGKGETDGAQTAQIAFDHTAVNSHLEKLPPFVRGSRLARLLLPLFSLLAFLLLGVGSQARAQTAQSIGPNAQVKGQYVKLLSFNVPDNYLRHYFFLGNLNRIETPQEVGDSTFKIVRGLAGSGADFDRSLASGGVSFQSVSTPGVLSFPGMYLRHFLFRLTLMVPTPDELFPKDATFKVVPGLADPNWISLQSLNYPGYYLRHRGSEFWLDNKVTDDQYRKDATFKIIVVK